MIEFKEGNAYLIKNRTQLFVKEEGGVYMFETIMHGKPSLIRYNKETLERLDAIELTKPEENKNGR